jgi:hypothetical protein
MSLAVLADHMASKGRGPDSMLIHMSPREVQGLQSLAMAHGGSLTVNPETGLPEAGFLDKLLPAILGFALAPMTAGTSLAFLGATPLASALTVGGLQTLRTGDIGKGISAGLGAYGGAGLQAGLATAGTSAIGGEAAKAASGLTGDMAFNLADAGSSLSNTLAGGETGILSSSALSDEAIKGIQQQAAADKIAAATPFDRISAGAKAAAANPSSLLTKDNFKYLAAGAAPILADQAVKSNLPTTTTKPGMIRPYSFDPYGGTYTAGTPYEAMPTKAAEGGLMGMNDGGYAPGQLNFAQRSEPVVRMAEGGDVQRFAIGDLVKADIDKAYAAGDYGKVNELAQANKITAEDVASTYKGFDTSGLAGLGINLFTPPAAPTYTQYTPEQIGSYLSNPANQNIDINKAIVDTNADPAAVNRYIASLTSPFVGAADTSTGVQGSGTFGIYNEFNRLGISPDEYYAAAIANDPKYAGWNKGMIQEAYNLNKGMYALSDAKKGVVTDTDWAKLMVGNGSWDKPQYDVNEMAQATGLSKQEVQARFDLEKLKANPIIKTITNTVTGTGTGTGTGGTNVIGAGTGVNLGTATNLPPGVSGGGNTYVNANGTITTRPDFSLPMRDVRDAYEQGGGSLGVNKNLFVPKTQDELFARYKNTGGSKAALDYLMGKTPYDPVPYTKTGEIQKPYWESVGRFPENRSTKKYVFVDGKYQLNPDYVKPSYVLAGEKAAALTNQDKEPTESPGAGNKWTWNSTDKKWEAKPIGGETPITGQNDGGGGGEANGGLMAMASGGMAGQFDLGGYSDGGRLLRGPGDGVSDSIPATIGNKRPARLADGEFVVPARIVSELGNGSTEAGARKLYAMMDRIQKARRGTVGKGKVAKNSRSDKYLPA